MLENLETRNNWANNVKSLLDTYGFSEVWMNPNCVKGKNFHNTFKNRVLDVFKQYWYENVRNSNSLCTYRYFKETLSIEYYLENLPKKFRIAISRLRLSSHKLRIEAGR